MIKQTLLLSLFISIGSSDFSQKHFDVYGCVPIKEDFLWILQTEVSNLQYGTFLESKREKISKEEYEALLPDTNCWRSKYNYFEVLRDYYLRHPAYNDYPVVGVSKKQAELFCEWATEAFVDLYEDDEKHPIKSILIRLPTNEEWEEAARGGLSEYNEYPWDGHSLRMEEKKWQGDFRCNFSRGRGEYGGVAGKLNDHSGPTAPVLSYWPNGFGLYNCAGNVAELVADRDVAKGGSWRSSGYNVRVTSEVPYTKPQYDIGFRYVIEVRERKPVNEKHSSNSNKKFFNKNFSITPSGIMVGKFEINNAIYNQFVRETGHLRPDSTLWNDQFPYSDQYKLLYHWYPRYSNYPVVNISKNDVMVFCDWLEEKYELATGDKAEIRLPTEEEWEQLARGGWVGLLYPWGGPYIHNIKGRALANYKYVPESFITRNDSGNYVVKYPPGKSKWYGADLDGALATAACDTYVPNDFGLYNMGGNVAEMVSDSSFVKGGSWKSDSYYVQIKSREKINYPSPQVGFRVVIIKKPSE